MSNRRFEMYQYRQVLVRMRLGDSDRQIARAGLMGRPKAAWLRQLAQQHHWLDPAYPLPEDATLAQVLLPARGQEEAGSASLVEPYREQVIAWWEAGIQGTTIHQALVRRYGFQGSYSAVRRFLQGVKADLPPQATVILDYAPGEAAQVDFGQGPLIVDAYTGEARPSWVFVMTLCFSRHQYAELVRDQTVATWLGCHRRAFEWFNGVPGRLIIDNAKCAITRACARDPQVQRSYGELAEGYGFRIDPCPPRQPQKKGRVEAGVKYIKRAFLPLRTFRSLYDANRQLADWVMEQAGNRLHGSTRQRPLNLFADTEQPLLQPLPVVAPTLATWSQVKVHRDAHVQFEKCLYSVPFRLMGQSLWLKATDNVVQPLPRAAPGSQSRPSQATGFPVHRGRSSAARGPGLPPPGPQWCLHQARQIGPACRELIERLFADRVLDNLRAAQGVIRLGQRFGNRRLEAACRRALAFDNPRYRSVKTILEKGLDQVADGQDAFDTLAESYTGAGRFCRDPGRLLNH